MNGRQNAQTAALEALIEAHARVGACRLVKAGSGAWINDRDSIVLVGDSASLELVRESESWRFRRSLEGAGQGGRRIPQRAARPTRGGATSSVYAAATAGDDDDLWWYPLIRRVWMWASFGRAGSAR